MRHSGAPVLTHCVAVAAIVAECGMPPAVVCAALLHDLEDTECPPERVAELFGPYVADLQRAIPATPLAPSPTAPVGTDPGCVPSFDESVLVIRLADRLHNMRTISFLSQATRWRKARETVEVFAPLARAAGLNQMSRELHDLASAELRSPAAPYPLPEGRWPCWPGYCPPASAPGGTRNGQLSWQPTAPDEPAPAIPATCCGTHRACG
jgi:(p)ppGpp synthase/HD superfamily hydrolase